MDIDKNDCSILLRSICMSESLISADSDSLSSHYDIHLDENIDIDVDELNQVVSEVRDTSETFDDTSSYETNISTYRDDTVTPALISSGTVCRPFVLQSSLLNKICLLIICHLLSH